MITCRSGHIINMSSVAGWAAAPLYSVYAATKFGVRGFTDSLRREVRHLGIRVSGVYPGGAATEFGNHTGDNPLKRMTKTPGWLTMSAGYVAQRVLDVARRPRRTLIIPWWMGLAVFLNSHFPGLVDLILLRVVKRYHE
jgi:short-subunit dehydrogenase